MIHELGITILSQTCQHTIAAMVDRSVIVVANKFEYEVVAYFNGSYYKWKIRLDNGQYIAGKANSVRQCYRRARRAYKLHLKMERLINP